MFESTRSTLGLIIEMLILLLVFGGVLFLAYVVTKKLAAVRQGASFNKNLKIIEVLGLGPGQYLYIVKIGEDFHLMSGTKEKISYCIPLEKDKLNLEIQPEKSFDQYIKEFTKGKWEKKDENKKE